MTARMSRHAVVVMFLVACGSPAKPQVPRAKPLPPPTPAAVRHFAGRVLHADGSPAAGAIINVSPVEKGDIVATTRSQPDGGFVTALEPGAYAVTATTETESVYMPTVDGRTADVELRLDAACERFVGRLRASAPLAADSVVNLVRISKFNGDLFGTPVSSDGAFRACLPAGEYSVEPPHEYINRCASVTVPSPVDYECATQLRAEADRVPTDMSGISPMTEKDFVASIPATTRLLGFGESNHGTREFYDERTALVKDLATQRGFRLLMLEAGYASVFPLDDYINGGKVNIEQAVTNLGYWTWDTKTFLGSLAEIRKYNATQPRPKRVHIVGFDVQNTSDAIKYISEHGKKLVSAQQLKLLEPLAADRGKGFSALGADDRAAIRAALAAVVTAHDNGGIGSVANRMSLCATELLSRFDMLEAPDERLRFISRDQGMAHLALEIVAKQPGIRAILWAHLGHLAREYLVGRPPMGAHLAAALGEGYKVYGLLALSGSARAWDINSEIGVIPETLRTPPPHGLEPVLASRAAGASVTYWSFATGTGDASRWLEGLHRVHTFGAVFMGEGEFMYWDLEKFDGAILFDKVSPTEPTPTGERRATPKSP